MKKVLELTEAQKNELDGVKYDGYVYFNVITDADGKYIISKTEQGKCDHEMHPSIHQWIHDLPEIDYNPYIPPPEDLI